MPRVLLGAKGYVPVLHDTVDDAVIGVDTSTHVRALDQDYARRAGREIRGLPATHPLWSHLRRSHRSSRAMRSAMRYRGPSRSSSLMTQSVMMGFTLA